VSAWTDAVEATNGGSGPGIWYRLGESAGTTLANSASGVVPDGLCFAGTFGVDGAIADGDTALQLTSAQSALSGQTSFGSQVASLSVACWFKIPAYDNIDLISHNAAGTDGIFLRMFDTGSIRFEVRNTASGSAQSAAADIPDDNDWHFAVGRFSGGNFVEVWLDGVKLGEDLSVSSLTPLISSTDRWYFNALEGSSVYTGNVTLDELIIWDALITEQDIADLYAAANAASPTSIPVALSGFLSSAQQSVPVKLNGITQTAQQSVPVSLRAPDPSHYGATAYAWGLSASIGATDVSASLVGNVSITHTEMESGLCVFSFIPSAGSIDPDSFERQPCIIDFVGKNASGATLYTSRRFTGITSRAQYDPDAGVVTINATTDLQGKIEQLTRDQIDALIPGTWSKHVFEEDADAWTYAKDRISTTPHEMHVDNYGNIVTAAWAVGAPIEFTDAGRFNNTLKLTRASRRDLITRCKINFDFRFFRLRHREINVRWTLDGGFCAYLTGEIKVPQKSAIAAAANSNAWVRISDIYYDEMPGAQANVCGGSNWAGGAEDFCLGAFWRAATRWAQQITEEYVLEVYAPDLEGAIGQQLIEESYGVQATYDGTDFEQVKAYSDAPTGAVFSTKTNDWQIEATDAEEDGRTAMEHAQEVAIAKVKNEMLERARQNEVQASVTFNPAVSLSSTVRLNTTHFAATGKVAQVREIFDLATGEPQQELTLAVSRHNGSGSASDTPIAAPDAPEQAQETVTPRTYYPGTHAGGTTGAPAFDPTWDGWISNAYGAAQTDPDNLYPEQFTVAMPEITKSERDATIAAKTELFEVEIPNDELTMSY